jgi:hypothetical protein
MEATSVLIKNRLPGSPRKAALGTACRKSRMTTIRVITKVRKKVITVSRLTPIVTGREMVIPPPKNEKTLGTMKIFRQSRG